jgi:muramoyltetrapeptide carboxypeptidase
MISYKSHATLTTHLPTKELHVCAQSFKVHNLETVPQALAHLKASEFSVTYHGTINEHAGALAGNDTTRLNNLLSAAQASPNPVVLAVRGGYGVQRIAHDYLQQSAHLNPLFIGFSDLTYLLNLIYFTSGQSNIHGPILVDAINPELADSWAQFLRFLAGHSADAWINQHLSQHGQMLRQGHAKGHLIGGNLTLLENLAGVSQPPADAEHILLLEDVGEKPYRIDRSLRHLKQSDFFTTVRGVMLGDFVDCTDGISKFGATIPDIVLDIFPDIPVIGGFPSGHGSHNAPVIIGGLTEFSATN